MSSSFILPGSSFIFILKIIGPPYNKIFSFIFLPMLIKSLLHRCPHFHLKYTVWMERVVKFEIKIGLTFMVPDLVYKF